MSLFNRFSSSMTNYVSLVITLSIVLTQSICIAERIGSSPEIKHLILNRRTTADTDTSDDCEISNPTSLINYELPAHTGFDTEFDDDGGFNDDDISLSDLINDYHYDKINLAIPCLSSIRSSAPSLLPTLTPSSLISPLTTTTNNKSNKKIMNPPSKNFKKTGTTIVGCLADNGRSVIIAADTRATSGSIVADKQCEKVHLLAANVWCCGAGTSGDIDAIVRRTRYTFLLRSLWDATIGNDDNSNNNPTATTDEQQQRTVLPVRVSAVCRFLKDELHSYGGAIGANLIVGGYEHKTQRAILAAIHPHGSIDYVPFAALGSGGLAAMAVLESRYRGGTESVDEAVDLAVAAVRSGIENDLGSGSQIDVCVIHEGGVTYRRAVKGEEVLEMGEGEESVEEELYRRHSRGGERRRRGVNGFGSLPYAIKSIRQVMIDDKVGEKEKKLYFDRLLEITK